MQNFKPRSYVCQVVIGALQSIAGLKSIKTERHSSFLPLVEFIHGLLFLKTTQCLRETELNFQKIIRSFEFYRTTEKDRQRAR